MSGARWLDLSYGYTASHIWRNLGIIIAFFVFFTATYLVAVEFGNPPDARGEVLVFPFGRKPEQVVSKPHANSADEENVQTEPNPAGETLATGIPTGVNVEAMKKDLQAPQDIFTWKNVCCDVRIKNETRRLLSNVSGYVKPGTLTALMGESGAGKTTLLDT